MPDGTSVIYVFGEGPTDIGRSSDLEPPHDGVVGVLTHALCGKPPTMLVQRRRFATLQGKGLWQKVRFAKQQATRGRSVGAVFVVDSEGGSKELKHKSAQLHKGRDSYLPEFPMAIGVAHPCIESWLLADASAIQRALGLTVTPAVPNDPETLPAPCKNRTENPKSKLAQIGGSTKQAPSAEENAQIAREMNDMPLVRARCPRSFAPFADEVERHIRPLF
ncbi:MAG: hypothetical protein A2V70_18550 [Planctomycetes bacterium RBG_13_63_9]|nr:MAG: hypothetical protein A2V70_18550 [Planctomycetes bacterium RBG_13_63_9]